MGVGAEAEYFLVRRTPGGGITVADPMDEANAPCYDARALTRMFDHITTVSRHMNALGWANYANDHEDANGQFEQNFRYADPLTTADRVIVFRYMVHTLAAQAGMLATFMPKPFTHLTGNGLHMHLSLWDGDGAELFADAADGRGLGVSSLGYSFIAGLLEHAEALTAVACPTVNSYKRLAAPAPNSGAAWSPTYATYGGNDRTHMLRVPEPGRVEDRCIDGSANPVSGHERADRGGSRRDRAWARPGRSLRAQPAGALTPGGLSARLAHHAHDVVARTRPPGDR